MDFMFDHLNLQSPWSLLAGNRRAPSEMCHWHLGGADSTAGLNLRDSNCVIPLDESREVKHGQRAMGHTGNPIVSMESITNAPSSTRYRTPTVTCGRVQNRTVQVITTRRTPSRSRLRNVTTVYRITRKSHMIGRVERCA